MADIRIAGTEYEVEFAPADPTVFQAVDEAYRAKYAGSPYLAPISPKAPSARRGSPRGDQPPRSAHAGTGRAHDSNEKGRVVLSGASRLFRSSETDHLLESPASLTRTLTERGHEGVCVPMQVADGDLDAVMAGLT